MEAVINQLVALGRDFVGPLPFGISIALGLFLATGTAARLLTMIEDRALLRRNS